MKTITMPVEEYEAELKAAERKGAETNRYGALVKYLKNTCQYRIAPTVASDYSYTRSLGLRQTNYFPVWQLDKITMEQFTTSIVEELRKTGDIE